MVNLLHTNTMFKFFGQWHKLILLTADQVSEKYNCCMQQFHLSCTNTHVSPVYSFYKSLWSTRMKASSKCRQMNPYSIFAFRAYTDSKQNNQHYASSIQEKILGTTPTWKAIEICSTFIIIIQVTNTQDRLLSGPFYWYLIKTKKTPEDSIWWRRVRVHLYLIEIYLICNVKCWLLHKWFT